MIYKDDRMYRARKKIALGSYSCATTNITPVALPPVRPLLVVEGEARPALLGLTSKQKR